MFPFEAVIRQFFAKDTTSAPIKCASLGNKGDYVILIHGLYDLPFSMKKITDALNKSGYRVIHFKYKPRQDSIEKLANYLLPKFIKRHCTDIKKKINFVTYSAGGIILRRYLDENKLLQIGRVVMIAPPNHGSEFSDFLKQYFNSIYKFLCGPIGQQLCTYKSSYVNHVLKQKIDYELGIIAGQGSLNLLSHFIINGPNDGLVSIESTKLNGMKDHIVIPAPHNIILFFNFTARKVLNFLKDGMF
jgi:hypothetical protein